MKGGDLNLVLVPGVGADQRMFAPQRAAFPDLMVPRWLTPHRNEAPYELRRATRRVCSRRGAARFGRMLVRRDGCS